MNHWLIKVSLLIFFTAISPRLIAQNKIIVKGIISGIKDYSTVSLKLINPYKPILSYPRVEKQVVIKNGKFKIDIAYNQPELYVLTIKEKNGEEQMMQIFLEPGIVRMQMKYPDLNKIKIENCSAANDFIVFSDRLKAVKTPTVYNSLVAAYDSLLNLDIDGARLIYSKMDSIQNCIKQEWAKISMNWILEKPRSKINSYVIYKLLKNQISGSELKNLISTLHPGSKGNSWAKELTYIFSNLTEGKVLPGFICFDADGDEVKLEDLRGNYVLLDFWASWCVPCKKNVPALLKVYNTYQGRNLKLVSISLDKNRKSWLDAIKNENYIWLNLSNITSSNKEIDKEYGISSIPFNFLLGPDGIIIAKNIWDKELDSLLESIFKEK